MIRLQQAQIKVLSDDTSLKFFALDSTTRLHTILLKWTKQCIKIRYAQVLLALFFTLQLGGHQELEIGGAYRGKMSQSRHFGDILETFGDILETFWRHFQRRLETFWRRFGDIWRHFGDILRHFAGWLAILGAPLYNIYKYLKYWCSHSNPGNHSNEIFKKIGSYLAKS